MLSIVTSIPDALALSSSGTPAVWASSDDPGLAITRLGRARFRVTGNVTETSSSLEVFFNEGKVALPLNPEETLPELAKRLEQAVPKGLRAFFQPHHDGSVEVAVLSMQSPTAALPRVDFSLSDETQACSVLEPNGIEITGIASGHSPLKPSFARLVVDGKTSTFKLTKGMSAAQTAHQVMRCLPYGYQARVETPRIFGSPVRVFVVRGVNHERAAA